MTFDLPLLWIVKVGLKKSVFENEYLKQALNIVVTVKEYLFRLFWNDRDTPSIEAANEWHAANSSSYTSDSTNVRYTVFYTIHFLFTNMRNLR